MESLQLEFPKASQAFLEQSVEATVWPENRQDQLPQMLLARQLPPAALDSGPTSDDGHADRMFRYQFFVRDSKRSVIRRFSLIEPHQSRVACR